jgi:hypothetical protein
MYQVSVFLILSYTVQDLYKRTVFMELNIKEILKDLHISATLNTNK